MSHVSLTPSTFLYYLPNNKVHGRAATLNACCVDRTDHPCVWTQGLGDMGTNHASKIPICLFIWLFVSFEV